eukprot:COSAG02_NODE_1743_length_11100_cov_17.677575_13_plen_81_part_00
MSPMLLLRQGFGIGVNRSSLPLTGKFLSARDVRETFVWFAFDFDRVTLLRGKEGPVSKFRKCVDRLDCPRGLAEEHLVQY